MKFEQFPTMEKKNEDIDPEIAQESLKSDAEKEANVEEKKEKFVQSVFSLVEDKLSAKLKEAGWDGESSLSDFKQEDRKSFLDKLKDPFNLKGNLIDDFLKLKQKKKNYRGHSNVNVASIIKNYKPYVNIDNDEIEKLHQDIIGSSYADRKKIEENSPGYGNFRMN